MCFERISDLTMDIPFFRNDAVILDRELHFFRGPLNNFLLSLYFLVDYLSSYQEWALST